MHLIIADRIQIEERVELIKELTNIILQEECKALPLSYRNLSNKEIKGLSTSVIKGILFEYYSRAGNIQACNNINIRANDYKNKIN